MSEEDPFSAQDTPVLERVAGSARKRLVVVPGDAHGVALLRGSRAATVGAAVLDFVRALGPPRHPQSLSSECGDVGAPPSRPIAFTAGDGVPLTGDVLGSGDTAVVLAHEYPKLALRLVPVRVRARPRAGFRVLASIPGAAARGSTWTWPPPSTGRGRRGEGGSSAMGASMGGRGDAPRGRPRLLPRVRARERLGETDLRAFGEGAPPLYAVPWSGGLPRRSSSSARSATR